MICGDRAGRGAGLVLPSDGLGIWSGDSFVRSACVFIARRRRLPLCRNYVEYYFADSAGARSVDRWVAPVSGSIARNRGGAGGDDGVATGEDSGVSAAVFASIRALSCVAPQWLIHRC